MLYGPLDPSALGGILILRLSGVGLLRLVCIREKMSGRGDLILLFRMNSLSVEVTLLLRLRRSGVDAFERVACGDGLRSGSRLSLLGEG